MEEARLQNSDSGKTMPTKFLFGKAHPRDRTRPRDALPVTNATRTLLCPSSHHHEDDTTVHDSARSFSSFMHLHVLSPPLGGHFGARAVGDMPIHNAEANPDLQEVASGWEPCVQAEGREWK